MSSSSTSNVFLTVNNHRTTKVHHTVTLNPKSQDSKVEMQGDNIVRKTVNNVVPEYQEFGRIKDTATVSRQCTNINKYNIIIRATIICSCMLLHVSIRVDCLSLCWYNIGEDSSDLCVFYYSIGEPLGRSKYYVYIAKYPCE